MNRKNLFLLAVIITGALAIMAGCTSPQFGAPGTGTTGAAISGRVATPESCFTGACDNPSITDGKPLPGAIALFYGGDSGKLEIEGETECKGSFEVNTTGEGSYVLYAVREYPEEGSGKYVVVKKGINNPRGDVGEANAYTTSQVIIWERANTLYGEGFTPFDASWYAQYNWRWSFDPAKLVLPVSEIPNLEPTAQLFNAVEKALSECRDPQGDKDVIFYANQIADATFGAPGGGGGGGGGTPAGGGGGGGAGGGGATTITGSKTATFNANSVSGQITVHNTGSIATTGLTIQDQLQKWNGSSWVDVGSAVSVDVSDIAAGGSDSFDYSLTDLTFDQGVKYRNKATISITNGNSVTVYDSEDGTIPNPIILGCLIVETVHDNCSSGNPSGYQGYGDADISLYKDGVQIKDWTKATGIGGGKQGVQFNDLEPGTYTVKARNHSNTNAYTPPSDGTIDVPSSSICACYLAIFSKNCYTISGTVFNDKDEDGKWDFSEGGEKDITVTLEGNASKSTTTGGNGKYSFTVPAGNYTVTITLPSGWFITTPSSIPVSVSVPPNHTVNFGIKKALCSK